MISKEEIIKVSEKCKIKISEEEIESFSEDFSEILEYVKIIEEVDLENVEHTYFINNGKNPLREDIIGESLPSEEAIKNAPDEKYGYFKLPNVME